MRRNGGPAFVCSARAERRKGVRDMTHQLTDVVRDAAAIRAERMALLVELTAWHFGQAQVRTRLKGAAPALLAEWHLGQAARLARDVAEQERRRCAEVYGDPMAGRDPNGPQPVGATVWADAAAPRRRST